MQVRKITLWYFVVILMKLQGSKAPAVENYGKPQVRCKFAKLLKMRAADEGTLVNTSHRTYLATRSAAGTLIVIYNGKIIN